MIAGLVDPSDKHGAIVIPVAPRVVPVHIRAIGIRLAKVHKITIGRNRRYFAARHPFRHPFGSSFMNGLDCLG